VLSDASIDEFVRPGHCDQIIQIERGRVVGTDGRQQPLWGARSADAD